MNGRHRALFLGIHPEPPWVCIWCEEEIWKLKGRMSLRVHHLDRDETNDTIENLAPVHAICHLEIHNPRLAAIHFRNAGSGSNPSCLSSAST